MLSYENVSESEALAPEKVSKFKKGANNANLIT
jgi:hypothetical protein